MGVSVGVWGSSGIRCEEVFDSLRIGEIGGTRTRERHGTQTEHGIHTYRNLAVFADRFLLSPRLADAIRGLALRYRVVVIQSLLCARARVSMCACVCVRRENHKEVRHEEHVCIAPCESQQSKAPVHGLFFSLLPVGTPSILARSLPPNPSAPLIPRVPSPRVLASNATHPEDLPANARVAAPAARLVVLQVARHDVGREVPVIDDLFVLVRLDFRLSDGRVGGNAGKAEQPGHRAEGGSSAPDSGHGCCGARGKVERGRRKRAWGAVVGGGWRWKDGGEDEEIISENPIF